MEAYKYPDKWLRLIGIPFLALVIRNFGVYEPLHVALKTKIYYLDLGWNILTVGLVWETNRQLILYLDKHFSWSTHRLERLLLQGALVAGLSVVEVIALTYLYNEVLLVRPDTFDIGWLMVLDVPLTLVFVVLVNMVYLGLYFRHHYQTTIHHLQERLQLAEKQLAALQQQKPEPTESTGFQPQYQKQLLVNFGYSSVPLATDNIVHVYKANELCLIKTTDGKEYTSNSSLENIEAMLNPNLFYRLNRQVLANVQAIKQFKPDSSGKLKVWLEPALPEEVYVSKKKAPEFKEWLGKKV